MNKITIEHINSKVVNEYYHVVPESTLTFCVLTLENGFTVSGESACADPANFNKELGEQLAKEQAINKVWMLEGYLLKQKLYEDSK